MFQNVIASPTHRIKWLQSSFFSRKERKNDWNYTVLCGLEPVTFSGVDKLSLSSSYGTVYINESCVQRTHQIVRTLTQNMI